VLDSFLFALALKLFCARINNEVDAMVDGTVEAIILACILTVIVSQCNLTASFLIDGITSLYVIFHPNDTLKPPDHSGLKGEKRPDPGATDYPM